MQRHIGVLEMLCGFGERLEGAASVTTEEGKLPGEGGGMPLSPGPLDASENASTGAGDGLVALS